MVFTRYLQVLLTAVIPAYSCYKYATQFFEALNNVWRTYDQQELDWLEVENGQLRAYEFKWSSQARPRVPKALADAYPEATFEVVNPGNYFDFVNG